MAHGCTVGISTQEPLSLSFSVFGVVPGPSAAWPVDYCLLMFQSAVCWGMWSYLTWTSPGVPRRRSVWAPPPSPALGTKLSHKHNHHTLATPGLQLCASHRREMGKTLHQGDRINLITNRLAKAVLTRAVPGGQKNKNNCWFTPEHIETPHLNGCLVEMKQALSIYLPPFYPINHKILNLSVHLLNMCRMLNPLFILIYFRFVPIFRLRPFNKRLPLVMWYVNDQSWGKLPI